MDNNSTENKDCYSHRISDKTLVVIDETLVRELAIDENETWFQQIRTKDGILLKIIRRSRL